MGGGEGREEVGNRGSEARDKGTRGRKERNGGIDSTGRCMQVVYTASATFRVRGCDPSAGNDAIYMRNRGEASRA